MFAKELQESHSFTFLGFVDNFQVGSDIHKPAKLNEEYDFVLILSQNHGNAIFEDFSKKISKKKLLKVEVIHGVYHFLKAQEVQRLLKKEGAIKCKQSFLKQASRLLDFLLVKREKIVFISKGSITSNNKALFNHCFKEELDVWMLTDNQEQYEKLLAFNMPVAWLGSWQAYILLAQAKITIQDQANLTQEINLLSPKQKTLQMWHGIPLKRLNKLTTVSYDYLVSTSDFVNQTSLSKVIEAKEYKSFGYPRNDLFLKENHDECDLLFCDKEIYDFAKKNHVNGYKTLLYMPTHRESSKAAKIPLDFEQLNVHLQTLNATLILKLHHFAQELHTHKKQYSNILFHSTQGDVYPLLKYTDILITDYSSVYFDFLLLNRPIIFFDYDKEEYEANMKGFLYNYEEFTPGIHTKTQAELLQALGKIFPYDYSSLKNLLFTYQDKNSCSRIVECFQN